VIREALEEADATLDDLDTVAVTAGPGLIGALLVGVAAAKGLAWGRGLPLVPVNHLHGHVASLFLAPQDLEPPFTCLLASGGHTLLLDVRDRDWASMAVLGSTLDDAAGEAFDKGARLLGLGYPGGAEIDRLAREGDPEAYSFPVARVPGLDFSFSGLKTALLYAVRDLSPAELEARRADLAASYQRAIVRALVERIEATGADTVAIVGGVAANSELRASLPGAHAAPLRLCTDNAAMIASAARFTETVPAAEYLALDAFASAT
jgi:N6-L-threonylcarbamoyladenine synthase